MMRTECAHCKKKFDDWNDYAHHILEKHPDDDIRVKWAKEALAPAPPAVPEKRKKKLPKHIRQQLDDYIKEKMDEEVE